ncbi:hypothetical protein Focb16_v014387 [Fusarium oxysporum f. sp. cubense]|uniref:Uncharacterized protein n=1 Tax=Fusarium oxysporum f. sp. cubense TaxID=61366 RepID=A0A559KUK7_FUSOC|nr:hypothetical protein Focb16_v014387 [Fusarium oxysporum f. sp. cubense]
MRNVFDKWEATEIPMVASRETRLVLSRMSPVSLEKAGGGTGSRRLRSSRALDEKYPMLLVFRPRSRSVSRVLITCFAALASPVQPHRSSRRSLIILTYFQVSFSSFRATLQHTDRPDQLTDASFEENQPPLLVPERQLLVRGHDSLQWHQQCAPPQLPSRS